MGRYCSSKRQQNRQQSSNPEVRERIQNALLQWWCTNNERCPVHYYKKFRSHDPAEMNNDDSPFYLAINYQRRPDNSIWYLKAPLNKNKIGTLMKTVEQTAGLLGNITNHMKNMYFSPYGCRSSRQLCCSAKRSQKPGEPWFVRSSVSWASAKNALHFKLLLWTEHHIHSKPPSSREYQCTGNPDVSFQRAGVFTGVCIGNIKGCSFTFNIHREKEESPVSQAQEEKDYHQRWFQFRWVNWTELNPSSLEKRLNLDDFTVVHHSTWICLPLWQLNYSLNAVYVCALFLLCTF